jgi:hydrogenase-4 component E
MTPRAMTTVTTLLAFLGLVAAVVLVWRQSRPARLRLFVAQSVLLALLATVLALVTARPGLLLVALALVVLKVWLIPRALGRMVTGLPPRPVAPGRSAGLALLAAGALVVAAYVVMLPVTAAAPLPTAPAIPLGFAMALIGLFVTVTGQDALGHVLGFLLFENGIFALALLATYGLPGLVEAGVFLDVLVIVLLMEGVVLEIRGQADGATDRGRQARR